MSATPPAPAISDEALRLVLFGPPHAGKSSLLAALGHAAATQPQLLGGTLLDRSTTLSDLGHQVYDGAARPTAREVEPVLVHFEPSAGAKHPLPATDAVLLDCDGQAANKLMGEGASLEDDSPEGTLAYEMIEADAVILALDASATAQRLETEFAEFGKFLAVMRDSRGARAEVAGLPVFLVLTKCDKLAQPGDSAGAWMERIESRKRDVGDRFKAFLASQLDSPAKASDPPDAPAREAPPFGTINLRVWATAIKRPALVGSPARPREPYGVAELFRQALAEAAEYRARYDRSQRKLMRLVIASTCLVGLLATLAVAMFFLNANSRLALLQARVEDIQFYDKGGPAEYLRGGPDHLRAKQQRLEEIRDDALFRRLPAGSRDFVTRRIEELTSYIPYLEKMLALRPLSSEQSEEGLDRIAEGLRNELALPRPEWGETMAGQIHKERLVGAEAVRKAVQAIRNWYLELADQGGRLWTFADYGGAAAIDWGEWAGKVEKLTEPERRPPFREGDAVPGVPGGLVTFSSVFRYDRVLDARAAWESDRAKLTRLLNIGSALGLVPPTKARPAALLFPRDMTLLGCKGRLADLKTAYPEYETAFVREGLPDVVVPAVRRAARRQYETLLDPARAEVLRQLRLTGKGEETAARWEPVRAWLAKPEELASWRALARVLQRLDDPSASGPVEALASFLAKGQFTVEVRSFTVELPESRGLKPRAESRLAVLHPASLREPALAFEPVGEPVSDAARRVVTYTFRLAEGNRLTYKPGDKLWAELPLTGGTERLVWSRSRSALYQFERLSGAPRLQSSTSTSLDEGRLLDDVRLVARPEDGVPPVPDLMPTVRLDE